MKTKINILVTGCGGDIGQSVGKILRGTSFINKLIGTDIHDKHPGKFIFDKCLSIPSWQHKDYFQFILRRGSIAPYDLLTA